MELNDWSDGVLEYWSTGKKKNTILCTKHIFYHYSNIPLLQYSKKPKWVLKYEPIFALHPIPPLIFVS